MPLSLLSAGIIELIGALINLSVIYSFHRSIYIWSDSVFEVQIHVVGYRENNLKRLYAEQ